MTPAHQF